MLAFAVLFVVLISFDPKQKNTKIKELLSSHYFTSAIRTRARTRTRSHTPAHTTNSFCKYSYKLLSVVVAFVANFGFFVRVDVGLGGGSVRVVCARGLRCVAEE